MEKKKSKVKIALAVMLSIVIAFAGIFTASRVYRISVTPEEYMIKTENYFDYQSHLECSGYASAYALRSLGEDVTGLELYESFTDKNEDGTLAPIFLRKNLIKMGYKCSLRFGTVEDLKYEVSRGTPVVVLIRWNSYQDSILHYVPVVGYDEKFIYVADSMRDKVNADNEHYNRKIEIEYFKELWVTDVAPLDNIYLTIGLCA